jgi:hypothetical protein
MTEETALMLTDEFKARVKAFKRDFYRKYKDISKEKTPKVDGSGRKIVDKRPDGYDYIIEAYMRDCLDKHFPGWTWEMGDAPQFLGSEWVVVWGTLSILDELLLAYGINPPVRKFSATNAARIKYKSGKPHTPENIIDIGNDVSGANSKAFKKAINQLTHIGDDVYGKRIDEEGAGSIEEVLSTTLNSSTAANMFSEYIKEKRIPWSKVFEILKVKSLSEVSDFKEAYNKLKEALDGNSSKGN